MPVITVARQFGSGGASVARIVAERLGLEIVDQSLIAAIAARLGEPEDRVRAEDEHVAGGRFSGLLGVLSPLSGGLGMAWQPPYPDPKYDPRRVVVNLTEEVIRETARRGNVVIVGRGGAFLLAGLPGALHVFLRAAEPVRLKTAMERLGLDQAAARKRLRETDANREAYMRQIHGRDWQDASHYDLVIDTGTLEYDAAAELIALAAQRKAAGLRPDAKPALD
jgi:cytidylate kinase